MKTSEMAAKWWADQLRGALPKEDYKEKIDLFEDLLIKAINRFLAKNEIMCLNSDGKPEYITRIFAEKAGLDGKEIFPQKTMMVIDQTTVKVMHGNGPFELIFSK